jgi:hypothetical protein
LLAVETTDFIWMHFAAVWVILVGETTGRIFLPAVETANFVRV